MNQDNIKVINMKLLEERWNEWEKRNPKLAMKLRTITKKILNNPEIWKEIVKL